MNLNALCLVKETKFIIWNGSLLTFWDGRTIGTKTKSVLPRTLGIVRDGPQITMRKFGCDDSLCFDFNGYMIMCL